MWYVELINKLIAVLRNYFKWYLLISAIICYIYLSIP